MKCDSIEPLNFHKNNQNWHVAWTFLGIFPYALFHLPNVLCCTNCFWVQIVLYKIAIIDGKFRDFFQATEKLYRHQFLCFQRMARHVFPYLIGVLLSSFWSVVLGTIEVFDSDMDIALLYYIFAGGYRRLRRWKGLVLFFVLIDFLKISLRFEQKFTISICQF